MVGLKPDFSCVATSLVLVYNRIMVGLKHPIAY